MACPEYLLKAVEACVLAYGDQGWGGYEQAKCRLFEQSKTNEDFDAALKEYVEEVGL